MIKYVDRCVCVGGGGGGEGGVRLAYWFSQTENERFSLR